MTYLKSYSRTVRSPGIPCGPVMYLPALLAARLLGQPRAFALAAIFIFFRPQTSCEHSRTSLSPNTSSKLHELFA